MHEKIGIIQVAQYIYSEYYNITHQKIDQMKLHKILYFVQRETIIKLEHPMFDEPFEAWVYGPVNVQVRRFYNKNKFKFKLKTDLKINDDYTSIINEVLKKYYMKDSWSLSNITHEELSWKRARIRGGNSITENGSEIILLEDIIEDAKRVLRRRNDLNNNSAYEEIKDVPVIRISDNNKIDLSNKFESLDKMFKNFGVDKK